MLKKLLTLLIVGFLSMQPASALTLQEQIKDYLKRYMNFLEEVQTANLNNYRMAVGDRTKLQSSDGLKHAIEVIKLVDSGALDQCCWSETPVTTPTYINFTTPEIIAGLTKPNPAYPNPSDPKHMFKVPENYAKQMQSVISQLRAVVINIPTGNVPDQFDRLGRDIMGGIRNGDDEFISKLVWGYSYVNPDHPGLLDSFTHYYLFACVLCDKAGFYDTSKLFNKIPGSAHTYYEQIVTPENFPNTYHWLNNSGFEIVDGIGPRLQPDVGLTMEGQLADQPPPVDFLDIGAIYPTHCHQAEELYFILDPMKLTKNIGSDLLKDQEGYTYSTNSYAAGIPNHDNLVPEFQTGMGGQLLMGKYKEVSHGDLVYNTSTAYHSLHPGRRFQFAQWARLTHPDEGTYFPLNQGPQPPTGVTCSATP